jgi:ATP-dependent Lon protease
VSIDDDALYALIREYTREAGVRNLEREIASICRKVARCVASGDHTPRAVSADDLHGLLGHGRHRYGSAGETDEVGVATGLVYTETGGDVVTVEVSLINGVEPKLTLTGQLGEVMRESAQTALTCVRSRAAALGADPTFSGQLDVHVHVPAGAVPKDGPSAGITIATAIASAATGRAVRCSLAMTGEVTLRGRVLPVGGIKEKVLGAHRAGLRRVIAPAENARDLEEVPDHVREEMTFETVTHVDEVFRLALLPAS